MTESCDWITINMWKSDGKLDHMTNESCDLGYEGIGDDNRQSLTADY